MDSIDKKLIELLQDNSRVSISDLSKEINLSRPSVKERIEKLTEKGVLKKFTVQVPPHTVGRSISFFIQISDIKISIDKLVDFLLKKDCINEIHAVTGSANYIIKAAAGTVDEMNALLEELMPLGKVETSIILNSPLEHRPIVPILVKEEHILTGNTQKNV